MDVFSRFLNHIHERAPMLIYDDNAHEFQDILGMTKYQTIHKKKKKILKKEIYKFTFLK